ncbi:hypothetical protein OROGR_000936 [Orobanche gracilis]
MPPETDVSSLQNSPLSARILRGSNIVLSKYAGDGVEVVSAEFVKSSVRTEDCPSDGAPELALVGQSNVGKSSLLNSLVRRKRLAITSKKPGKTQCINHFRINDSWYLVDLPGYGYASAPHEVRKDWTKFTKNYFLNRPTLVSVFLLIDASIPAKRIDLEYASWLGQNQVFREFVQVACMRSDSAAEGNRSAAAVVEARRLHVLAEAPSGSTALFRHSVGAFDDEALRRYSSMVQDVAVASLILSALPLTPKTVAAYLWKILELTACHGSIVLAQIIKQMKLKKLEVFIKSISFDIMEMVLEAIGIKLWVWLGKVSQQQSKQITEYLRKQGYPIVAHCLDVIFSGTRAQIGSGEGDNSGEGCGGPVEGVVDPMEDAVAPVEATEAPVEKVEGLRWLWQRGVQHHDCCCRCVVCW